MTSLNESKVENLCIELLQEQGYSYLSQEKQEAERELDFSQVVLQSRLKSAIKRLNPTIPPEIHQDKIREALQQVLNLPHQKLIDNNEAFHKILTEGVSVEYQKKEGPRWYSIFLIDFENPKSNDFLVCNQFTVTQNNEVRRTDLVLFVNGLPLVVLELKNPTDEQATVHKAFTQLQNYKKFISKLFFYNEILVASDGLDAKAGSLSADWDRFIAWKSVDGIKEEQKTTSQIETLIKGMLRPVVLLDLIRHFTVFEKTTGFIPARDGNKANITQIMTLKKIAAYHQYFTVNKAVESTIRALAKDKDLIKEKPESYEPESYDLESVEKQKKGDKRVGIVWHTQGSGKSLSMVFYAGKLVVDSRSKPAIFFKVIIWVMLALFPSLAGINPVVFSKTVKCRIKSKRTTGRNIPFISVSIWEVVFCSSLIPSTLFQAMNLSQSALKEPAFASKPSEATRISL